MPNFEIGKDKLGTPNYIISVAPVNKQATTLAALTEQLINVPPNVNLAIMQYEPGANVFVGESEGALSIPGAAFTGYQGDLNVPGLYVSPGAKLRFISDTTAFVVVKFYQTEPAVG